MRHVALVVALCCGGLGCESLNYYAACGADGGGMRSGYGNEFELPDAGGEHRPNDVFVPGSKLFGAAQLFMDGPSVELLSVRTRAEQPQIITVTLAYTATPPTAITAPAELVAILEIGLAGNIYKAEVDYIQGTTFSLAANSLRIAGIYRRTPGAAALAPGVTPPPVTVGASLCAGAVAQSKSPQRTISSETILAPGAAAASIVVPAFAKTVLLMALPAAAVVQLDQFNLTGGWIAVWPVAATPSPPFPLAGNAQYMRVTNTGGVDLLRWSLVFDLAL